MISQRSAFAAMLLAALCAATAIAFPIAAHADALQTLNSLRLKECGGRATERSAFKSNSLLARAAGRIHQGTKIRDALMREGYRADQSALVRIGGGSLADDALRRLLVKNYCSTLTDPNLTEVGIAQSEKEIAIIFAAPFTPPTNRDARDVSREVLALVNAARAKPKRCGNKQFDSAAPLELNDRLLKAAIAHAKDMAARSMVTHEGADGSTPAERIARTGYAWKFAGENVAGGQSSAKEVVAGWLASPGHCRNIMDPDFSQMAVAYSVDRDSENGIYWAQVFARPR
jgi:uncharacterized protein YkwD